MDVIYQKGLSWKQSPKAIPNRPNALIVSYNNWDDYGYQTTFNAAIFKDGQSLYEFALKIYIPDTSKTSAVFDSLIDAGWDGVFPPPGVKFLSLPSDIVFYEALLGAAGVDEAKRILLLIRDAGFLDKFSVSEDRQQVSDAIQAEVWRSSLTREAGAKKAFQDGWKAFEYAIPSKINDFTLYLPRQNDTIQSVDFSFNSKLLPYDVNVLIGPNGVGKSYSLKTLVEYWLGVGAGEAAALDGREPFSNHPNISKLILVSYSPFEEFTLDLEGTRLQEKDAYRYFGFRYQIEEDGKFRVGINRNLPASDSVESLSKAFSDDDTFDFMDTWIGKVDTIKEILAGAIDFDQLAFEVDEHFAPKPFENVMVREINNRRYLIPYAPTTLITI